MSVSEFNDEWLVKLVETVKEELSQNEIKRLRRLGQNNYLPDEGRREVIGLQLMVMVGNRLVYQSDEMVSEDEVNAVFSLLANDPDLSYEYQIPTVRLTNVPETRPLLWGDKRMLASDGDELHIVNINSLYPFDDDTFANAFRDNEFSPRVLCSRKVLKTLNSSSSIEYHSLEKYRGIDIDASNNKAQFANSSVCSECFSRFQSERRLGSGL